MIHMKPKYRCLFCIAGLVLSAGQTSLAAEPVRLTGIINLPKLKQAIITVNAQSVVLAEGERQGNVEMLSIDPILAAVRMRLDGTNDVEAQVNSEINLPPSTLLFENLPADELLIIYQEITKKTLLRAAATPNSSFTLHANAANASEAATVLEMAMAKNGISVIPLGENFAAVIPEGAKDKAKLPLPPAQSKDPQNAHPEMFRAGALNFKGVDVEQVALILAELKHQKVDDDNIRRAPHPVISVRSMTPLTKAEAIYAIETSFLLNGIRVVEDGSNMVRLEPSGGR